MRFIVKLFDFDRDQKGFERGLSYVLVFGFIGFLIYCIVSSFGVFDNFLSRNGRWAGGWWHALGVIALIGMIYWDYINFSERIKFRLKDGVFAISFLLAIILVICINCGFRFDHF